MPYCTLEEAWAPVSYPTADLYNSANQSIYSEQCPPKQKKVQPNFSRTNARLAKHRGPINREPNFKNQILRYGENNTKNISEPQISDQGDFNYVNNDVPNIGYDMADLYSREEPEVPVHQINLRSQKPSRKSVSEKKTAKDMDSIDRIIAEVEDFSDDENDDNSSEEEDESILEMPKDKMIKYLMVQNQKLKKMLKGGSKTNNGVFNIWDFVIVLLLGIIMVIILDYVYKIAIKKIA